ncbi:MAG: SprT family zinc-dependent metalloprotease [Candidatus Parcubacteria bacterium]|nr:SprT family zinc-dependent metalloprotease [Candidatus Parcubacteria bacterium]
MNQICFGSEKIPYILKRYPRSKRVRLSISRDRALLVTAPKRTPFYFIEQVLQEKQDWIRKTLKYFESFPKPSSLVSGRKLYEKHKEEARELVSRRLVYWNQFYNFSWGRISIRNQKTRWGSCSKKGNLNFSYKLALLPQELSDYVIVHELCHLKEFNHSKNFWNLVSQAIPDHKEKRKALHQHRLS